MSQVLNFSSLPSPVRKFSVCSRRSGTQSPVSQCRVWGGTVASSSCCGQDLNRQHPCTISCQFLSHTSGMSSSQQPRGVWCSHPVTKARPRPESLCSGCASHLFPGGCVYFISVDHIITFHSQDES